MSNAPHGLDPNNLDRGYNIGRALAYIDYALGYNGLPASLINNFRNLRIFYNMANRLERKIRRGLSNAEQTEYLTIMARIRTTCTETTVLTLDEQLKADFGRYHQYAAHPEWRKRKSIYAYR